MILIFLVAMMVTGSDILHNPSTGSPLHVVFHDPFSHPAKLAFSRGAETRLSTLEHFFDQHPSYGIEKIGEELKLISSRDDPQIPGWHIDSYQQLHSGFPVVGGMLKVVYDENDDIVNVNGLTVTDLNTVLAATVNPFEAIDSAINFLAKRFDTHPSFLGTTSNPNSEDLVVYRRGLTSGIVGSNHLAYPVHVEHNQSSQHLVYVDANTNKIIEAHTHVHSAMEIKVYGTDGGIVNITANTANDGEAIASLTSELVYTLFKNILDYDSYDNAGASLTSRAFPCFHNYASGTIDQELAGRDLPYWNSKAKEVRFCSEVLKKDDEEAIDVLAHEWAHAWGENLDGLVSHSQAGALHEHFSDIIGASVEITHNNWDDAERVAITGESCTTSGATKSNGREKWVIGEDLKISFRGTLGRGIMDLWNPTCKGNFGQGNPNNTDMIECGYADNGMIHANAGIPNRVFAMVTDGNETTPGIGLDKALNIYLRAKMTCHTPTTTFLQHAECLELSCHNLEQQNLVLRNRNGVKEMNNKIKSSDCELLTYALQSVGMKRTSLCDREDVNFQVSAMYPSAVPYNGGDVKIHVVGPSTERIYFKIGNTFQDYIINVATAPGMEVILPFPEHREIDERSESESFLIKISPDKNSEGVSPLKTSTITYFDNPYITDIIPREGSVLGGLVTIIGVGFKNFTGCTKESFDNDELRYDCLQVWFNDVETNILSLNENQTQIIVEAPPITEHPSLKVDEFVNISIALNAQEKDHYHSKHFYKYIHVPWLSELGIAGEVGSETCLQTLQPVGNDALLADCPVSGPCFFPDHFDYGCNVNNNKANGVDTAQLVVNPKVYEDEANITQIDGQELITGPNLLQIHVNSSDGKRHKIYQIVVERRLSVANTLRSLEVYKFDSVDNCFPVAAAQAHTLESRCLLSIKLRNGSSFIPDSTEKTIYYTQCEFSTTDVWVIPHPTYKDASVLVHETDLGVGDNTISITIHPEDPTANSKAYLIHVNRSRNTDARAGSLRLTGGCDIDYNINTTDYSCVIGPSVFHMTFHAYPLVIDESNPNGFYCDDADHYTNELQDCWACETSESNPGWDSDDGQWELGSTQDDLYDGPWRLLIHCKLRHWKVGGDIIDDRLYTINVSRDMYSELILEDNHANYVYDLYFEETERRGLTGSVPWHDRRMFYVVPPFNYTIYEPYNLTIPWDVKKFESVTLLWNGINTPLDSEGYKWGNGGETSVTTIENGPEWVSLKRTGIKGNGNGGIIANTYHLDWTLEKKPIDGSLNELYSPDCSITPRFTPNTATGLYNYSCSVPHNIEQITLYAHPNNLNAKLFNYSRNFHFSSIPQHIVVNLSAIGETTTILLQGSMRDGHLSSHNTFLATGHEYQIDVFREYKDNTELVSLEIEGCNLRPPFQEFLFDYACEVSFDITRVNLSYTRAHPFENSDQFVYQSNVDQNLEVGKQEKVGIQVFAQNGIESSNYTIRISRLEDHRAYLSDLQVKIDSIYEHDPAKLVPNFDKMITEYTCIVEQRVASVDLIATIEIGSFISAGGHEYLVDGDNRVEVVVTAPNHIDTRHYVINVVRADDNAHLHSLEVDGCTLRHGDSGSKTGFDRNVFTYHCFEIITTMGSIVPKPVRRSAHYEIKNYDGGFEGLNNGTNLIPIVVTAENTKTTLVYYLWVAKNMDNFDICARQNTYPPDDCRNNVENCAQKIWFTPFCTRRRHLLSSFPLSSNRHLLGFDTLTTDACQLYPFFNEFSTGPYSCPVEYHTRNLSLAILFDDDSTYASAEVENGYESRAAVTYDNNTNPTNVVINFPEILSTGKTEIKITKHNQNVETVIAILWVLHPESGNTFLKSLTLSNCPIAFTRETYNYYCEVDAEISSVTLEYETDDKFATAITKGGSVLFFGNNTVVVEVFGQDESSKEYTITVFREKDDDATIKYLSINCLHPGLQPPFAMANHTTQYIYNCEVDYTMVDLAIDLKVNSSLARINTFNSKNLDYGTNDVTLRVIAQNEVDITEVNFFVIRNVDPNDATIATLIDFSILCDIGNFRTHIMNYTCKNDIVNTQKKIDQIAHTVRTTDPQATFSWIQNELNVFKNQLTLRVRSEDSQRQNDYFINVNRLPSDNNELETLNIDNGCEINVVGGKSDYSCEVEYEVASVKISVTADDQEATVDKAFPLDQDLNVGLNTFEFTITASDTVTAKVYTVEIERKSPSTDNTLKSWTIRDCSFIFDAVETEFYCMVNETAITFDCNAEPNSTHAEMTSCKNDVDVTKNDGTELYFGYNKISITVKAQDQSTKNYSVIITKMGVDDVSLIDTQNTAENFYVFSLFLDTPDYSGINDWNLVGKTLDSLHKDLEESLGWEPNQFSRLTFTGLRLNTGGTPDTKLLIDVGIVDGLDTEESSEDIGQIFGYDSIYNDYVAHSNNRITLSHEGSDYSLEKKATKQYLNFRTLKMKVKWDSTPKYQMLGTTPDYKSIQEIGGTGNDVPFGLPSIEIFGVIIGLGVLVVCCLCLILFLVIRLMLQRRGGNSLAPHDPTSNACVILDQYDATTASDGHEQPRQQHEQIPQTAEESHGLVGGPVRDEVIEKKSDIKSKDEDENPPVGQKNDATNNDEDENPPITQIGSNNEAEDESMC